MKRILMVLLTLGFMASHAQDRVYRKDGKVLRGKVLEVSDRAITFRYEGEDLIYRLDPQLVEKIVYESGRREKLHANPDDNPVYYAKQRSNSLKITPFLFNANVLQFSFERSFSTHASFDVEIDAIGIGDDELELHAAGIGVGGSVRFYVGRGKKNLHRMKGWYLSPHIKYQYYLEDHFAPEGVERPPGRNQVTSFYFLLTGGYQMVFNDRVSFDIAYGAGYRAGTPYREDRISAELGGSPRMYGYFANGTTGVLTSMVSLKIGLLLD